jgi:hypothetical protein
VVAGGPFEPEAATWYTDADRREQLDRLARACAALADLYEDTDAETARSYRDLSITSAEFREHLPPHGDLKQMALALPPRPMWLDPRMPDYQGARQPWHDDVRRLRHALERTALELRALATYDVP